MTKIIKIIKILCNPETRRNLPHLLRVRFYRKLIKNSGFKNSSRQAELIKKKQIFSEFNAAEYLEKFPCRAAKIIDYSGGILKNGIELFGVNFRIDKDTDWFLDPKDSIRWAMKKYDERNVHYTGSPKDVKIVWELNRHQYLFSLSMAYRIKNDDKYAGIVIDQLKSWIDSNKVGEGINWASPMEVSIRLISWILTLDLLKDSADYIANQKKILQSIYEHITFLDAHLSDDRILPTNHLIGELSGLIIASLVYEFNDRDKIYKKSIERLSKELEAQVFADGVSKEQSTSYHRFVLDFLTLIVSLCKKFSVEIENKIPAVTEAMFGYINNCITPDGSLPIIGDGDNGRGFLITAPDNFWNMEHALSNYTALFNHKSSIYASKEIHEETYLLGLSSKAAPDSKSGSVDDLLKIQKFEFSGHYIIRNEKSFYMFVRSGVFGMGGEGFSSHSHFDLLSPVLYLNSAPVLIDSGTFVYNGDPENRNNFRIAKAHNNINFDNLIASPKLNFGWNQVCDAFVQGIEEKASEINLKCGLKKVNNYIREFAATKNSLVITDHFLDYFDNLQWNFHLHPESKIISHTGNKIIMNIFGNEISFESTFEGLLLEDCEISFDYGIKQQSKCIVLNKSVDKTNVRFTINLVKPSL